MKRTLKQALLSRVLVSSSILVLTTPTLMQSLNNFRVNAETLEASSSVTSIGDMTASSDGTMNSPEPFTNLSAVKESSQTEISSSQESDNNTVSKSIDSETLATEDTEENSIRNTTIAQNTSDSNTSSSETSESTNDTLGVGTTTIQDVETHVATQKSTGVDTSTYFRNPISGLQFDGAITESSNLNGWQSVLTDQGTLYVGIPSGASSAIVTGGGKQIGNQISNRDLVKKIIIATPCTVTDYFYGFFSGMSNVISIDNLTAIDTTAVTSMESLFKDCTSLKNLDLSAFNTSKTTNMGSMFKGDQSLVTLNINSFDTSKNVNFYSMFQGMTSLTTLLVSNSFDTSSGTDMSSMFAEDRSLTMLPVGIFNTSNVTRMPNMFKNMTSLKMINVANFDTSHVFDMTGMFSGCTSLSQLDLRSIDTSLADISTTASGNGTTAMLAGLTSVEALYLGTKCVMNPSMGLPELDSGGLYTGKWQNVAGTGTFGDPQGDTIWSSSELMNSYDPEKNAGSYVWQPKIESTTETKDVSHSIHYSFEDGSRAADDVVDTVTFERSRSENLVTGVTTYSDWSAKDNDTTFDAVTSPVIDNYTPDQSTTQAVTGITADSKDSEVTVIYKANTNATTETKDVKQTIHYVYEDGKEAAPDKVDTVTFTRTVLTNEATGGVSSSDWQAKDNDMTFDDVISPTIDNYKADKASVEEVDGLSVTDKDTEVTVTYSPILETTTETKEVKQTIHYVYENGKKAADDATDKVSFTREATKNLATDEVTYSDWKAEDDDTTFDEVTSPELDGFIADKKIVSEVTGLSVTTKDSEITVTYVKFKAATAPTTPLSTTTKPSASIIPFEKNKVATADTTKQTDKVTASPVEKITKQFMNLPTTGDKVGVAATVLGVAVIVGVAILGALSLRRDTK